MNVYGSRKFSVLENRGFSNFKHKDLAKLLEKREYAAICNMQDRFVFVSGGMRKSSVERFDIAKNTWNLVPSMHHARSGHASCALEDTLYAICGEDDSESITLNSIEVLDSKQQVW